MLEELGHDVVEAAGGAAALAVLAHDRRFDLLVIDFAMPLMNGGQLAAEVTKLWAEAPILFVTGYVENDALRPWSELGYQYDAEAVQCPRPGHGGRTRHAASGSSRHLAHFCNWTTVSGILLL